MKRKVVSVILCGTMVLGMVTGCGSSKGGDSGDKVTINLYQNKSEISSQLQEAADKYTEENPNVTINVESIQGNDYNTNLKAKLISDDSVDIYALGDNITNMTDYVEDLSDQEWLKNAVDGSSVSYTHLRAHETDSYLVCRLLLEKKKHQKKKRNIL